MNINDAFVCPVCKHNSAMILSSGSLFSNVAINMFSCTKCRAEWRCFWNISEQAIELTSPGVVEETQDVDPPITDTKVESVTNDYSEETSF